KSAQNRRTGNDFVRATIDRITRTCAPKKDNLRACRANPTSAIRASVKRRSYHSRRPCWSAGGATTQLDRHRLFRRIARRLQTGNDSNSTRCSASAADNLFVPPKGCLLKGPEK